MSQLFGPLLPIFFCFGHFTISAMGHPAIEHLLNALWLDAPCFDGKGYAFEPAISRPIGFDSIRALSTFTSAC
jgi:hypothetical protein